jgi:hypothetical protein
MDRHPAEPVGCRLNRTHGFGADANMGTRLERKGYVGDIHQGNRSVVWNITRTKRRLQRTKRLNKRISSSFGWFMVCFCIWVDVLCVLSGFVLLVGSRNKEISLSRCRLLCSFPSDIPAQCMSGTFKLALKEVLKSRWIKHHVFPMGHTITSSVANRVTVLETQAENFETTLNQIHDTVVIKGTSTKLPFPGITRA